MINLGYIPLFISQDPNTHLYTQSNWVLHLKSSHSFIFPQLDPSESLFLWRLPTFGTTNPISLQWCLHKELGCAGLQRPTWTATQIRWILPSERQRGKHLIKFFQLLVRAKMCFFSYDPHCWISIVFKDDKMKKIKW